MNKSCEVTNYNSGVEESKNNYSMVVSTCDELPGIAHVTDQNERTITFLQFGYSEQSPNSWYCFSCQSAFPCRHIDAVKRFVPAPSVSVTVHSTGDGQAWVDGQYWWHIPGAPNTYDPFYAIGQMLGRLLNVVNAQLPSNHDNRLAKEHLSYIERELDKLIKSRLRQR